MTAGSSRIRKTGSAGTTIDTTNQMPQQTYHASQMDQMEQSVPMMHGSMMSDHGDHMMGVLETSVSDHIDLMTNDQGDVFYGPAPKVSFKLDDSFESRNSDTMWEEIKQKT